MHQQFTDVHFFKQDCVYTVTEQPGSSCMFKMPSTSSMVKRLKMKVVWTWMGLFGHDPLLHPVAVA